MKNSWLSWKYKEYIKINIFKNIKCDKFEINICEIKCILIDIVFALWVSQKNIKYHIYDISCLWNIISTIFPVYEISYLRYFLFMKYHIYDISCLWNILSMKCPVYEMFSMKCSMYKMPYLWNVLSMKCPIYEMSYHEMSYLWNVLSMKFSIYEMFHV